MAKEFEHVSRGILSSELGVIGIPTNSSGAPDGVARAPKVLRQGGSTVAPVALCWLNAWGASAPRPAARGEYLTEDDHEDARR